jgi:hypothetical protein
MKLHIEISTGGAAFSDTDGYCGTELCRILARFAGELNAKTIGEVVHTVNGSLRDSNGNKVGQCWVTGYVHDQRYHEEAERREMNGGPSLRSIV